MAALPAPLRSTLEKPVIAARDEAEKAAGAALTALAVERPEPFATLPATSRMIKGLRSRGMTNGLGGGSEDGVDAMREATYDMFKER